jgi:hypothetical protein
MSAALGDDRFVARARRMEQGQQVAWADGAPGRLEPECLVAANRDLVQRERAAGRDGQCGLGRHAPAAKIRRLPGRGGPPQFPPPPSMRSAPNTPGVPHGCASGLYTASMAFAPISRGSALPAAATEGKTPNDAAGFASCYGPRRRLPLAGLSTLGSDPARFPAEPPACYRASWQLRGPDFHRQATTSLRTRATTIHYVTWSPPVLLGARMIWARESRTTIMA